MKNFKPISDGNIKLLTIGQLAMYYAVLIDSNGKYNKDIPDCDFGIADESRLASFCEKEGTDYDILEELGCIESAVEGWYGLKSVGKQLGFDSEFICLATDYYGGGALMMTQVADWLEDKTVAREILDMIMMTLSLDNPHINEDEVLYVEFYNK